MMESRQFYEKVLGKRSPLEVAGVGFSLLDKHVSVTDPLSGGIRACPHCGGTYSGYETRPRCKL